MTDVLKSEQTFTSCFIPFDVEPLDQLIQVRSGFTQQRNIGVKKKKKGLKKKGISVQSCIFYLCHKARSAYGDGSGLDDA